MPKVMRMIQSPFFWLIVAVAVVIVLIAVVRHPGTGDGGFKDVLKHPERVEDVEKAFREMLHATEAAQDWSDAEVEEAVRHFVFDVASSDDAWSEAQTLRAMDSRAHPTVLAILKDPTRYEELVIPTGVATVPEAPFNRACDVLGDTPPVEAVEAVAPFLDDPSEGIRGHAALVLGKVGAPEAIALVKKALRDDDDGVRQYALMGLEFAVHREQLHEAIARELYSDVQRLLEDGETICNPAGLLFHFDRQRAIEFFLSDNVFAADSPIVHEVLRTMAGARVPVPRERLLELIKALEATDLEYPREYALGEALKLLGQRKVPGDEALLKERMSHADENVASGAAEGLLSLHGLDGFEERLWKRQEENDYESLSDSERHYIAVLICDAEVKNGGFSQYFFNSSGDSWRDALAGLKAMGSTELLGILNDALAKFSQEGPSARRRARQKQLSRLVRKDDSLFDSLDSRYYDASEAANVLAMRFVFENPDDFR